MHLRLPHLEMATPGGHRPHCRAVRGPGRPPGRVHPELLPGKPASSARLPRPVCPSALPQGSSRAQRLEKHTDLLHVNLMYKFIVASERLHLVYSPILQRQPRTRAEAASRGSRSTGFCLSTSVDTPADASSPPSACGPACPPGRAAPPRRPPQGGSTRGIPSPPGVATRRGRPAEHQSCTVYC